MSNLKPDHKKWADLVIQGTNPADACVIVCPNITRKTALNKAGLFGKRQDIQDYIKAEQDKINKEVRNNVADELTKVELGKVLSANEKRAILTQIISGQLEIEKLVIVKGVPKKIKCKPDSMDIMKAIEIDNKMSGDNVLAKPNQVAKAQEVNKIIVLEDESNPIGQRHPDDNTKA